MNTQIIMLPAQIAYGYAVPQGCAKVDIRTPSRP
jgi:hypothetical protein